METPSPTQLPQRAPPKAMRRAGLCKFTHPSKGQPEFALTDDAGKVITYVQSTSSLNLRRYLQQPVTVYGARGLHPQSSS